MTTSEPGVTAPRVAVATCLRPERPDEDLPGLVAALAAAGLRAEAAAWDDAAVDFGAFDAVVVRSTWNYIHAREAFAAWVQTTAARAALWNPANVVSWNAHKGYLLELADQGLPVIRTRLLAAGSPVADAFDDHGEAAELVIKPAVSAGSFATIRADSRQAAEAHLRLHLPARDMLVQPFLPAIVAEGEWAVVFLDGEPSHAAIKRARFAGDRQSITAVQMQAVPASVVEVARAVMTWVQARFGQRLPYARVDVARADDAPLVMEVELIEPDLYLRTAPGAFARLAEALRARL